MRDYLVDLREQRNETQQDVAGAIGVSRQYYSMIEDGSRQKRMDIALVGLLANHFGVPMTEIIEKEQENQKAG